MILQRLEQTSGGACNPTDGQPHAVNMNRQRIFKRTRKNNIHSNYVLWCELCKVPCMNKDLLKQHLNGKQHKANLKKFGLIVTQGSEAESQKKWCSLCEISCTNELNFKQHIQGKKHALRLCLLEKTNPSADGEVDLEVDGKEHNVGISQYALCNCTIQRDVMESRASRENIDFHSVNWKGCWIFVDTILEAASQAAGTGLVMLDENRQLNELQGKKLWTESSERAKAEAIREAFIQAQRKGWKEILILSDAREVILQINGSSEESENIHPILQDIKRLSNEFTVWLCLNLPTDKSKVYNLAHTMADFSLTTNCNHSIIPPFEPTICDTVKCSTSIVLGGIIKKGIDILL